MLYQWNDFSQHLIVPKADRKTENSVCTLVTLTEFLITRCLDFSSKYTKMRLEVGLCPDALGELTALPGPLAGFGGTGWDEGGDKDRRGEQERDKGRREG